MKKNHRRQYLDLWLKSLKGKNEIVPKTFFPLLEKKLKGAYSPPTLKRYNAALLNNLIENGYVTGKKGKGLSGDPLPIVQEITGPVLDKCLTRDLGRITFTEADLAAVPVSPPKKIKSRAVKAKTEAPAPAVKAAAGRKKAPARKKAAPQPAKKAGRPAAKKSAPPAAAPKGPKAKGLVGRQSDLLRMGQGSFLFAQQLTQQIEELERQVAAYQRVFEGLQQLFGREMEEMEDWILKLMD
ncbi:MAG: hypothetical protein HY892_13885 [Deltaproteobacteria bacterium]|nr:hypothetical protein [Deltaproteobacteria bacterium]